MPTYCKIAVEMFLFYLLATFHHDSQPHAHTYAYVLGIYACVHCRYVTLYECAIHIHVLYLQVHSSSSLVSFHFLCRPSCSGGVQWPVCLNLRGLPYYCPLSSIGRRGCSSASVGCPRLPSRPPSVGIHCRSHRAMGTAS